jgi:hypothetical protein
MINAAAIAYTMLPDASLTRSFFASARPEMVICITEYFSARQ